MCVFSVGQRAAISQSQGKMNTIQIYYRYILDVRWYDSRHMLHTAEMQRLLSEAYPLR